MAALSAKVSTRKRILDRLWTQPGTSYAAFAGKHLLRRAAAEPSARKTRIVQEDVDRYLTQEPAYTQHAPSRKTFPKPFYNMSELYHLVEVDLIETGRISSFNDGVRYLLIAIECTSRKIFVVPMQNKTGQSSTNAFRQLLDHQFEKKPCIVRSDRGSEWKDAKFQKLLSERGIHHLYANNTEKAAMVERAIQTLQRRIHRYLTHNNTYNFLPALDKIVKSINDTPHASTSVAPNNFTSKDVYPAWERYYLSHIQPPRPFRFKPGDTVRASLLRREGMDKSYRGTFTPQIFTIVGRRNTRPHSYMLADYEGNQLVGEFFEEELIRAKDRPDQTYTVGDIVARRVNPETKKKEVQVTWEGWPKTVRTWLPESEVVVTARARKHGRLRT